MEHLVSHLSRDYFRSALAGSKSFLINFLDNLEKRRGRHNSKVSVTRIFVVSSCTVTFGQLLLLPEVLRDKNERVVGSIVINHSDCIKEQGKLPGVIFHLPIIVRVARSGSRCSLFYYWHD